jgi:c(7)-type cytochrome triheme protein
MQAFTSLVSRCCGRWLAGGLLTVLSAGAAMGGNWLPLAKDGVHDPKSPAVKQLQQPRDALSKLTPDGTGNQVRWVQAIEKGEINPRGSLHPGVEIRKLDQDILLNLNGGMPIVRFPHLAHSEWLDCANCHDHLFEKRTGGTRISMQAILQGEQCGVCHGAVAFPLTECQRCHSVTRPGRADGMPAGANLLHHRQSGGVR